MVNLLTKQAKVIVTDLHYLLSARGYFKEVVTAYQNFKTCIVLEGSRFSEADIMLVLNAVTCQRKVKQSMFEDEGRDELK